MQKNNQGISLIEAVISMAIFALFAASIASLIMAGLDFPTSNEQHIKAELLAREGIEAAIAIKNNSWENLSINQSGLTKTSNQWGFIGEGSVENIDGFSRTIKLEAVYRNTHGDISDKNEPGAILDPDSKKIISHISWQNRRNATSDIYLSTLLSNFN